jgi:hypothetical protein
MTTEQIGDLGKEIANAILFNPGHIPPDRLISSRLAEILDTIRQQQREADALLAEGQKTGKAAAKAIRGA